MTRVKQSNKERENVVFEEVGSWPVFFMADTIFRFGKIFLVQIKVYTHKKKQVPVKFQIFSFHLSFIVSSSSISCCCLFLSFPKPNRCIHITCYGSPYQSVSDSAYRIVINESRVKVIAGGLTGLHYAITTLLQILDLFQGRAIYFSTITLFYSL